MIEFNKSIGKLFPGLTEIQSRKLLNKFLNPGLTKYIELSTGAKDSKLPGVSSRLFILRFGIVNGVFRELLFTEVILRKYILSITKFGNFWTIFRFVNGLAFLTLLVTFSGGLSTQVRLIDALEVIGAWTICELGFSRTVLAARRYKSLSSRFGINLRIIVAACYLVLWIEIITLFAFCNIISFITRGFFLSGTEHLDIAISIACLAILFLPISYGVARISTNNSDAKFLVSPFFRMFILTTPLFINYHTDFPVLYNLISFLPTNFAFVGIIDFLKYSNKIVISFIVCLSLSWTIFLLPSPIKEESLWKSEAIKSNE